MLLNGAITSLFSTPEQLQAKQVAARRAEDMAGGQTSLQSAVGAFGRGLAGDISGVRPEDSPAVALARTRQEAMKGVGFKDREGLFAASQKLVEAGDYEGGLKIAQLGHGIKVDTAKEGAPSTAQKKYEELVALGVAPQRARSLAFGALKTPVDPTTGAITLVDYLGGTEELVSGTPATTTTTSRITEGGKPAIRLSENIEDLSDAWDDGGMPTLGHAIGMISNSMEAFPEGTDIEGMGQTGALHKSLISERGVQLRQRVASLMNLVLKDRSGAAVTVPEFDRFKKEFNAGLLQTDEDFRNAFSDLKKGFEDHKESIAAGYSDAALSTFSKRSGIKFKERKKKSGRTNLVFNPATGKIE